MENFFRIEGSRRKIYWRVVDILGLGTRGVFEEEKRSSSA